MDQTGLDWTPVDWALYQPIWPGRLGTGIHWSPVESIWITWGRVKTSSEVTSLLNVVVIMVVLPIQIFMILIVIGPAGC